MLVFNDYNQFKKYYNEDEKAFIFTEHGELADIDINFEIPPYLSKTINIVANNVSSSNTLIGKSIDCNNLECPNLDFGHINCENITNVESIRAITIEAKNISNIGTIICTRIKCDNLNAIDVKVMKKAIFGIANIETLKGIIEKSKKHPNSAIMRLTVSAEKIICKSININCSETIGELFFEEMASIDYGEIGRKIEGKGELLSEDLLVGAMLFSVNEDESEKIIYSDLNYSENKNLDEEIGLVKCPIIKVTKLEAKNVETELFNVQDATIHENLICKDESFGNYLNAKTAYLDKGGLFNQIASDKLISGGKLVVRNELSISQLVFNELVVDAAVVDEMRGSYMNANSVTASDRINVGKIEVDTIVAPEIFTDLALLKVKTREGKIEGKIIDKALKKDINEYTA